MPEWTDFDEHSTLLQHKLDPSEASDVTFALTVVDGPDRGRAFVVRAADPPALLGQSAACAVRLTDREVSRRHASLEVVGDALHLVDLGSTNGTFVGGVAVDGARLRGGETVRVGSSALAVHRGPPDAGGLSLDVAFGRMLGASAQMRRLYPLCHRLAASNVPVFIEGETGTGKEVLAESLHDLGPRAAGPFVVFDCTAVPPSLMDAELFGHEKGAFTGAVAQRRGLFEQAHGGTLFIDEIGELDVALQSKLLRAVERGEVRRVGGDKLMRVDLRVIAATRRDLDREVQEGRFRDDLFHRLAVGRIALPALRERRGDVALLAARFWRDLGGAGAPDPAVLARWDKAPWPGNVRELRNAVARQIALGDVRLVPDDAAEAPREQPTALAGEFIDRVVASGVPLVRGREEVAREYERRYIARVLAENGGNVVRAARASGIARRHFQRLKARIK